MTVVKNAKTSQVKYESKSQVLPHPQTLLNTFAEIPFIIWKNLFMGVNNVCTNITV